MNIQIKNLGALKQAKFELGALTIICGVNNTGKTYATYALFGFLYFWRDIFPVKVEDDSIRRLLDDGAIEIDIQDYIKNADDILKEGCKAYTEKLPTVFASSEKHFSDTEFMIDLDIKDTHQNLLMTFEQTVGALNTKLFSISKKSDTSKVSILLLVARENVKISNEFIKHIVGNALNEIVFGHFFPRPFIASAERTGAAIFRKELDFARNRLIEQMGSKKKDINPSELFTEGFSDYALPVKRNVEFMRQLEELAKKDSFIAEHHPELLKNFALILGGAYKVTKNDELYFVPSKTNIKLTMDESSSAVRSMLDIWFYLRHVAQVGDMLMIDEPELNLHPANQRRVARLLSSLVNLGIKVFITTHSDYIVKELNTLIMLNHDKPHLKEIAEREKYKLNELLSADKVRVYIAENAKVKQDGKKRRTNCQTLTSADIDSEFGIEARSFDKTIEDMNRIQEEIVWGGGNND